MASFSATLAIVLLQCCLLGQSFAIKDGLKSERELRSDIFDDYDKLVRPVKKYSKSISVTVGLSPLAVRELNERTQVLTLDSWLFLMWTDDYLQWEPSDYDGINVLRVPPTEVWKPDVTLYTSLTDEPIMPTIQTQVLLYSNGSVMWVPPFTLRSRCVIPFSKVPKDTIECNIRFGSWTYGADSMDIKLRTDKVDLTNFYDNNIHWKLVKVDADRQDKYYPCCEENYPVINYNITLMRRWTSRSSDSPLDQGNLFA